MADVNTELLQAASVATYGLDWPGGLRRATGLDLDPAGICRRLWGKEINEALVELLGVLDGHGVLLPGVSGSYLSTPDHASLDITGDIDVRWEGYTTSSGQMISKWTGTGDQRSYRMFFSVFTTTHLSWSTDGTSGGQADASELLGTNAYNAWRATLDVDNGASGRTVTFYGADSIDGPWTELGVKTTAGTTSIFSGSAGLLIGAENGGSGSPLAGRFKRAQVYNGIGGTLVADPDVTGLSPGATSFVDSTGKTWTVHGDAEVV